MSDDKTVKNFLEEGRAEAKELINDILEDVFDEEMPEIIDNPPPKVPKKKINPILILVPIVLVLAAIIGFKILDKDEPKKPDIITVPAITKIINIEELSTFTTTYKGIVTVKKDKTLPLIGNLLDNIKYHVAYEAKVNVGLNLSKAEIVIDESKKEVQITLPEIVINDIIVDFDSMDFMFHKEKYDKEAVTREAYSECNADVKEEASAQEAIFDLAKQNAVNIIDALVKPVVYEIDPSYTVVILCKEDSAK